MQHVDQQQLSTKVVVNVRTRMFEIKWVMVLHSYSYVYLFILYVFIAFSVSFCLSYFDHILSNCNSRGFENSSVLCVLSYNYVVFTCGSRRNLEASQNHHKVRIRQRTRPSECYRNGGNSGMCKHIAQSTVLYFIVLTKLFYTRICGLENYGGQIHMQVCSLNVRIEFLNGRNVFKSVNTSSYIKISYLTAFPPQKKKKSL